MIIPCMPRPKADSEKSCKRPDEESHGFPSIVGRRDTIGVTLVLTFFFLSE